MRTPAMRRERALCRVQDVPDGGARGLLRRGNDDQVFALRQGDEVFVWLNDCPHDHRPLELRQDHFLSADGRRIVCHAHSAQFDPRSGVCLAGPCEGGRLVPVPSRLAGGVVWIAAELPTVFD